MGLRAVRERNTMLFNNLKAQAAAQAAAKAQAQRKQLFNDSMTAAAGNVVGQVAVTAVIGLGLGLVDGVLKAVNNKKD